jgi:CRISPR/Cas system-associated exonuclease Cas4 (RecB family)
MSGYYKGKRSYSIFDPKSSSPYKLSRSRIELFMNCKQCFYIDRRLGVDRPPGYPFSLNSAVDKLLKKEFDIHRAEKTPHPLMKTYEIDAVPLAHDMIEKWRDALHGGITHLHKETNLFVGGGIDDVWVAPSGEFIIVDYKATSKDAEVTLDADWQIGYKRQMEIYQWLFRQNGFNVSETGYFVYCNGNTDKKAFDGKLEFDIKIIPYVGDTNWVDGVLQDIKNVLMGDKIPPSSEECDYCLYRKSTSEVAAGGQKSLF